MKDILFYFLKIYYLFIFWLCRVLVDLVARGIFVEACGIFRYNAGFFLVVACGFSLSSCGTQAPEHVGSVVCSPQPL